MSVRFRQKNEPRLEVNVTEQFKPGVYRFEWVDRTIYPDSTQVMTASTLNEFWEVC